MLIMNGEHGERVQAIKTFQGQICRLQSMGQGYLREEGIGDY